MQPGTIVEALDVVEDVAAGLGARIEREVVEPLGLDRVEEAFGKGMSQQLRGRLMEQRMPWRSRRSW